MPTYTNRLADRSIAEYGVSLAPSQAGVETEKILTETIFRFSDISGYLVGEQITETTSSVTGYISWINSDLNAMGVIEASDEFDGDKVITGGTSSTAKTPTACQNRLNRTADTPIYHNVLHSHDVSSSGSGDNQTIYVDARTTWILLTDVHNAQLSVYNGSTSDLLHILSPGHLWAYRVDHRIPKLVLAFSEADTCLLQELEATDNPLAGLLGGGEQTAQGYDITTDLYKTQEQSPGWAHRTDSVKVINASQDLTGSWVDLGSEIDARTYNGDRIWITVDINDSIGPKLRIIEKHESGGAEEYPRKLAVVSATGEITLVDEVWLLGASDALFTIPIELHHNTPYQQLQVMADIAGVTPGQIDASYVTKG